MRIAVAAVLLVLVGCATDLTPEQQVYSLQRQLDVALGELEVYAAQPPCDPAFGVTAACHDERVLLTAVVAAGEADLALDEAEAIVRANGGDATPFIAAARRALAVLARELAKREHNL